MHREVKWPAKYNAFYKYICKNRDLILEGTFLAVDPSTGSDKSSPAYALYVAGKLKKAGTIKVNHRLPWSLRLVLIARQMRKILANENVDFLAIEMMRGTMSGFSLMFSVGAFIAAVDCENMTEVPVNVWKAVAEVDPNYVKDDIEDAKKIGESVILYCQEHT